MTDFWQGKRVLVTGATGFLGSHLVPKLQEAGASVVAVGSRRKRRLPAGYDLREMRSVQAMRMYAGNVDFLFHLAANVGGIGYNQERPADLLHDNALMGLHVLNLMRERVGKFVVVGSTCAYPKYTPTPFREEDLWSGYPEETNAPYGLAKRLLLAYLVALGKQYGTKWVYAIPTNMYGPRDQFDPARSHVIPALIRKMTESEDEVVVWGTGDATRDFLYAGDCADGLLILAEKGRGAVNLGSGRETSIRQLVRLVAGATGYNGSIMWARSKPDGQPRRLLDITRAHSLGWEPKTTLEEGLTKTVGWWLNEGRHGDA